MSVRASLFFGVALVLVGCGSGSHGSAPTLGDTDITSDAGSDAADASNPSDSTFDETTSDASDAKANDATTTEASSDAGTDDGVIDTGFADVTPIEEGVPSDPICDPNGALSGATALSISTPEDDLLLALTKDEKTIVWLRGSTLVVSDRSDATAAFPAPATIDAASFGVAPSLGAGVSGDGLRLAFVATDGRSFVELTRATRGAAFGSPGAGELAGLNQYLTLHLSTTATFADPILSDDGLAFVYSTVDGREFPAAISRRATATDPFPIGETLAFPPLAASSSARAHLHDLAIDDRTLTYLDGISGHERAAFMNADATYLGERDYGAIRALHTTTGCAHLYYSAAGSGGLDLFTAKLAAPP